jgi:DNA-binding MarR family transcriptional regulator
MPSSKKVQSTHISEKVRELHRSILDIVSVVNQPLRAEAIINEAGISLDRALIPILVRIERFGPIGVVELAERVGRDYTTVSRQIAKMESLGLVERQECATDRRARKSVITAKGKEMTDIIDVVRQRIGLAVFESWDEQEIEDLVRLMRKFADALADVPQTVDNRASDKGGDRTRA